jgi:8-oxo-dGTP pyrophosphatase MutT (NUDIX family)
MTRSNLAKDEAFGIVPILQQLESYQFLLIQHHAGHWGFPKGHADPGESALQAACREFEEETGITDYHLMKDLSFSEQYNFHRNGTMFEKTVVYYPAFVQSATVKYQRAEIRAYAWEDYDAAIARLSFNGAKQILTDVYQYLTTSKP